MSWSSTNLLKTTILGALCFLLSGPLTTVVAAEKGVTTERTLTFSGLIWKVKASQGRVGPGSNYFSDSTDNVWVDDKGRLHVKITQKKEAWYCAEVISMETFGFGTYRFHLSTPLQKLDQNITLGLFTWSDAPEYSHREIDIECGKWGKADDPSNAQFVVQPYQRRGRLLRYSVPENLNRAVYSFVWKSESVTFQCLEVREAAIATRSEKAIIKEWTFSGKPIPQPGGENVRINLWLSVARPPKVPAATEMVVDKFEFIPFETTAKKKTR